MINRGTSPLDRFGFRAPIVMLYKMALPCLLVSVRSTLALAVTDCVECSAVLFSARSTVGAASKTKNKSGSIFRRIVCDVVFPFWFRDVCCLRFVWHNFNRKLSTLSVLAGCSPPSRTYPKYSKLGFLSLLLIFFFFTCQTLFFGNLIFTSSLFCSTRG